MQCKKIVKSPVKHCMDFNLKMTTSPYTMYFSQSPYETGSIPKPFPDRDTEMQRLRNLPSSYSHRWSPARALTVNGAVRPRSFSSAENEFRTKNSTQEVYLENHRSQNSEPAGLNELRKQVPEAKEGPVELRRKITHLRDDEGQGAGVLLRQGELACWALVLRAFICSPKAGA